jgi:hypothetical protein
MDTMSRRVIEHALRTHHTPRSTSALSRLGHPEQPSRRRPLEHSHSRCNAASQGFLGVLCVFLSVLCVRLYITICDIAIAPAEN